MHFPIVAFVHVGQRRGNPAFGHDCVRLAQQALANQTHRDARRRGLNGGPQTRAAGANHQHVMFEGLILSHQGS